MFFVHDSGVFGSDGGFDVEEFYFGVPGLGLLSDCFEDEGFRKRENDAHFDSTVCIISLGKLDHPVFGVVVQDNGGWRKLSEVLDVVLGHDSLEDIGFVLRVGGFFNFSPVRIPVRLDFKHFLSVGHLVVDDYFSYGFVFPVGFCLFFFAAEVGLGLLTLVLLFLQF